MLNNDDLASEEPGQSLVPALQPPKTIPAVKPGDAEPQVQGPPPEVNRSSLGAALDSLSGLKSPVVNVIAIAAYQEAFRRAAEAEQAASYYRDRFHDRDRENAVLTERIAAAEESRRLRQILLSLGGPVIGAGITLCLQANWPVGVTLSAVGGLLMALGHGWSGGGR